MTEKIDGILKRSASPQTCMLTLFFATLRQKVIVDVNNKAHQDIIWRSRSKYALPLLAEIIKNTTDPKLYQRYFRAFDFHTDKSKTSVLISLVSLQRADSKGLSALALRQVDSDQVKMTPGS